MILVTGGTGLLGSHLLYGLVSEGNSVRAIKRKGSDLKNVLKTFSYYSDSASDLFKKVDWVEGDILDRGSLEDAFEGITKVYHTAAMVSFISSQKRKILENNINGTANVVNVCLAKNIQKLCHVSSVAALGHSAEDIPVNEDMIWSPSKQLSYYSVSKFHSEMEVWRGIEEGLNAIIVNPSIIIGPGNWEKSTSAIFKAIYRGLKFYPPGHSGFVDVRDVAKFMVLLMESNISNERYILNSENCSFKEVFENIALHLGKSLPSIELRPWLGELAWRAEMLRSLIFRKASKISKETISAGFNNVSFSNEKIKKALEINFIPVKESIKNTAGLFLNDLK